MCYYLTELVMKWRVEPHYFNWALVQALGARISTNQTPDPCIPLFFHLAILDANVPEAE